MRLSLAPHVLGFIIVVKLHNFAYICLQVL